MKLAGVLVATALATALALLVLLGVLASLAADLRLLGETAGWYGVGVCFGFPILGGLAAYRYG